MPGVLRFDPVVDERIEQELFSAFGRDGLIHHPAADGDHIAGVYRQRVTLASGRFAMIDNGLGFELSPWRPVLDPHLGKQISGLTMPGGNIDWNFGRKRGPWL